jgi:hypothetical protein
MSAYGTPGPSPIPRGFIYLGWADFHSRSQVLLQHRTNDTPEHLLIPIATVMTLNDVREALFKQFGIISHASSPGKIWHNTAVRWVNGKPELATIDGDKEWKECLQHGVIDAIYMETTGGGGELGKYNLRVCRGPWKMTQPSVEGRVALGTHGKVKPAK